MKVSNLSFGLVLVAIAVPFGAQSAPKELPNFSGALQWVTPPSSCTTCGPAASPGTEPGLSADAWHQAGFRNVTVDAYPVESLYGQVKPTQFTHGMDLTLVLFRGTGWDKSEIQSRYGRVAQIYAQCGVKISRLNYVEADPYQGITVVDNSGRRDDLKIAQATPDTPRPVVYMLEHGQNEHRVSQVAYSWRNGSTHNYTPDKSEVPLEPALMNTAWITHSYKKSMVTAAEIKSKAHEIVEGVPFGADGGPLTIVRPEYSVEAHELGHILTNSGHYEGKGMNFLYGSERLANDKINASQCEAIRRHPLVKPL